MKPQKRILFFDGHCNLCNGFINFVVSRNKKKSFYIASLQGETAQKLLDLRDIQDCSSVILLQPDGQKYYKSSAVIQVLRQMGGFYWLLSGVEILPKFVRDFFYDLIAQNRYNLFGKKHSCRIPTEEERGYFLD